MVDFSAMMSRPGDGSSDSEVDLRGLFREANMNDGAVIFFDECEYIFKSRYGVYLFMLTLKSLNILLEIKVDPIDF